MASAQDIDRAWSALVQRVGSVDAPTDVLKDFYKTFSVWTVQFSLNGDAVPPTELAQQEKALAAQQSFADQLEKKYPQKVSKFWKNMAISSGVLGLSYWFFRSRKRHA